VSTVPGLAGECDVEGNSLASDGSREVAVHVDQSVIGNRGCYLRAEPALGVAPGEAIDAVDDARVRFRESLAKHGVEVLVFGRTRAAILSEHSYDGSITRATVRD
jgi:hypothetical protein